MSNPFEAMFTVLSHLCEGDEADACIPCQNCLVGNEVGQGCERCKNGLIVLTPINGWTPTFRTEAAMVLQGNVPIGLRDPIIRTIIIPMVQAHRLLCDNDGGPRRFEAAKKALQRCVADDWRQACLEFIEAYEKC